MKRIYMGIVLCGALIASLVAGSGAMAAPIFLGVSISGPNEVAEKSSEKYKATALYSDYSTKDLTNICTWSVNSASASILAGILNSGEISADESVVVKAVCADSGTTKTANKNVVIRNAGEAVTGSHAGYFSSFNGTSTCLECHYGEAVEMHDSVHYQWKGDTASLVNHTGEDAGKRYGINDFCIYVGDINWIGKMVNSRGEEVDGGCAKCHAGLGLKPDATATAEQLENIDCLVCHSDSYKRKVGLVNNSYRFIPDEAAMGVSILQAASDITLPSNNACLNCHTKSGGGNNFKRGDIEEAHRNPVRDFDVHLASAQNGGAGLKCLDCHAAANHKIAGRGVDLRPMDSSVKVKCDNCHSTAPHPDSRLNKHTKRVNCNVCHIPAFAKSAPTDMRRDWSVPGDFDAAKGLYDPHMTKMSNVVPEYRFWNGQSEIYEFGEPAIPGANGKVLMAGPVGSLNMPGSKINAFKHHTGRQPIDPVTKNLLPLKIGIFFQTGDFDLAVKTGTDAVLGYSGHEFAETERYLGLFHEVAPKEQALTCNNCHNGGTRLNFSELGYALNSAYNGKPLCASCHGDKSGKWGSSELFTKVHQKHVDEKRYDCGKCHNFSAAN